MITIYNDLFKELELRNVFYCSWKSNHFLNNFLNGHGDLDLYVDLSKKSLFESVLFAFGFKKVKSYVSEFPFVFHYIGLDTATGLLVHLHVYFKLVTGESNSKNYVLPLEKWLKKNIEFRDFNVPTRDAQQVLFLLRFYIKIGSFSGCALYYRDKKKYNLEWAEIQSHGEQGINPPFSFISEKVIKELLVGYKAGKFFKIFYLALKLKFLIHGYSRMDIFEHFLFKISNTFIRLSNKIFFKRKKELECGLLIAICGLDGSGKSTSVDALSKFFSDKFSLKVFHIGRPKPNFFTFPFWLFLKIFEFFKHGKLKQEKPVESFFPSKSIGIFSAFRYTLLAYERYLVFKKASKYIEKGFIVIFDRYPSFEYGKMDSPRVTYKKDASFLYNFFHKLEGWFYSSIGPADLVLHLNVPVETSILRNKVRNKVGKETDNEIVARHIVNSNIHFHTNRYIRIDAEKPMIEVHKLLINNVWEHLS